MSDHLSALRIVGLPQLINIPRDIIQSKHDQILTQIEDIPIEFGNKKNTQRILAFLDYCYGSLEIRNKVINSDKITYSLIECLNTIDYESIDNFEAMFDLWRICIKYFNIPSLGKQPYFSRLEKIIHTKCCLLHNLDFIRAANLKEQLEKHPNCQELISTIMNQYTIDITGDLTSLNNEEMEKIVSVAMLMRLKLLNLILTFYNLVLDSHPDPQDVKLVIEMNISTDNYFTGEITSKDDHLNLSLLMPLLDNLIKHISMFRLWDFTSTLSETLYLTHKLIDFANGCPSGSKLIYFYLEKLIEEDKKEKYNLKMDMCDFGQNEQKTKLRTPYSYLKNVFQTLELLPTAEGQSDLSLVKILQRVFDYYDLTTNHNLIFTEHMYQSFLIVLSRIEIQKMDKNMLTTIFTIFNESRSKYFSNINVFCQLVFLKRLIIYWFEDFDIFEEKALAEFYSIIFDKFDEYMSMMKSEKLQEKLKKTESQMNLLMQHSIKNSKAIKIIEESINHIIEENNDIRKLLSIPTTANFQEVFEEHISYLKCITIIVYEILILSFKFEKFTKRVDPVKLNYPETFG